MFNDPKFYMPRPEERGAFGEHWCMDETEPPKHGDDVLCARYGKLVYGRGILVDVYRSAMPAVFYTIRAGKYELRTGSSQHDLAANIAEALSTDMLGLDLTSKGTAPTWTPPEMTEHAVEIGRGVLTWNQTERKTDRYGAVVLLTEDERSVLAPSDMVPFAGKPYRLFARIEEMRTSGHLVDFLQGFCSTETPVGSVLFLGEGRLFSGFAWRGVVQVGLEPEDGRDHDWLDGRALFACHDQLVTLYLDGGE